MGKRDSIASLTQGRFIFSDPAAQAGGPPNLDEFVNGPLYNSGHRVEDVDVEAERNPKR